MNSPTNPGNTCKVQEKAKLERLENEDHIPARAGAISSGRGNQGEGHQPHPECESGEVRLPTWDHLLASSQSSLSLIQCLPLRSLYLDAPLFTCPLPLSPLIWMRYLCPNAYLQRQVRLFSKQWFFKCGPGTSSIRATWEVVRNEMPEPPLSPSESETLGVRPADV